MKKILVFIMILPAFQVALAQDTDSTKKTSPAPTIAGSVDVYYRYNFNDPKSGATHTGLKADIGLGKKSALMPGIANTTDVVFDAGSRRYLIGQVSTGTNDDKVKLYLR